ncbi:acetyl-CoA C-acetyltransferase [Nocardia uniformis]|uniref:Acetyl-CoA C-acetyltransferase n=1 Tax=Nocardia uniformis TaxID=53432 RepID=A0A849BWJ1_9NOCA|nr:acetyl-CoA C-acetyltransferase [Nocardia uniformis]NNH70932.1 acetyl-CoA C-acetyltransferase [Nocardia uniformis]
MAPTDALVFDAIRTPRGIGKRTGALYSIAPVDLATGLIREMLRRNPEVDPTALDDVVLGCVSATGEQGFDIAEMAVLRAGLAGNTAGVQLNRYCASGLEAVNIAAQKIASGWEDLVFAGGVESMSRVPMGADGGLVSAADPNLNQVTPIILQGPASDLLATTYGYERADLDRFAARSQSLAVRAWHEGRFKNSVVPVTDINGTVMLDHDELVRPDTTIESLGTLAPAFETMGALAGFDAVALQRYHWVEKIEHRHTAGNSSGIVDGAALLAIGNERVGREFGLRPRARIVATAVTGSDPSIGFTGPAPATRKALRRAGLTVDEIDLFEVNEAFAAVVLVFAQELGVELEKINVNGGAIAMGHPLGATGAMLLGTVIDELERTGGRYGLVTLCAVGGIGIATIVERLS